MNVIYNIGKFVFHERVNMAEVKETIAIDILDKIDVRVGTIISVEDVEGSDKLVKFTVDFGSF